MTHDDGWHSRLVLADAELRWAHPVMWNPWTSLVSRCDGDTLLAFLQQAGAVPVVDVGSLGWASPLGGMISAAPGGVRVQ